MLLVHATSTCDICLETYHSAGQRQPCVIPCGHIACRGCFQSFETPRCPYCRDEFYPEEVTGLRCEFAQLAPPGEDVPIASAGAEDPPTPAEPRTTAADLARECEARLSDILLWDYSNRPDRVRIANDIRTFAEDFVVQHISDHYPNLIPTFDNMMQVVNNLDDILENSLGRQEDQEDPDFAHEARQYRRSQRQNGWLGRFQDWRSSSYESHVRPLVPEGPPPLPRRATPEGRRRRIPHTSTGAQIPLATEPWGFTPPAAPPPPFMAHQRVLQPLIHVPVPQAVLGRHGVGYRMRQVPPMAPDPPFIIMPNPAQWPPPRGTSWL